MAPPPEYDKEPKAPDKSATIISNEDSKILNCVNDHQIKTDHKASNTVAHSEIEKHKAEDSVENLDDGRLRALLDEAITYKCPKDREGKSDLFKNLLEEAEQDDQASEAAARTTSGGGRVRRGAGRRALAHSNSLQDLVAAALAAEPAPRRPRPHAPVSARATHGGSLPSGVDTSFLLGEEPTRAGYLATVRCVNPPPFAERRVSASDANCPAEVELLHRRSKPVIPMTYTARATLEIGSGSVSSGRAVTTTTASNQVRTFRQPRPTVGPPERLFAAHSPLYDPTKPETNQSKLMGALCRPRNNNMSKSSEGDLRGPSGDYNKFGTPWSVITARYAPANKTTHELICYTSSCAKKIVTSPIQNCPQTSSFQGSKITSPISRAHDKKVCKSTATRFISSSENEINHPTSCVIPSLENKITTDLGCDSLSENKKADQTNLLHEKQMTGPPCQVWRSYNDAGHIVQSNDIYLDSVDKWYKGLSTYAANGQIGSQTFPLSQGNFCVKMDKEGGNDVIHACMMQENISEDNENKNRRYSIAHSKINTNEIAASIEMYDRHTDPRTKSVKKLNFIYANEQVTNSENNADFSDSEESDISLRKKYRKRVGHNFVVPSLSLINPRNIRPMSIGSIPVPEDVSILSPKRKINVKYLDTKDVTKVSNFNKLTQIMKTETCDSSKVTNACKAGNNISKDIYNPKLVEVVDIINNNQSKYPNNVSQRCEIIDDAQRRTSDTKLIKTWPNNTAAAENYEDIKLEKRSKCFVKVNQSPSLQHHGEQNKLLPELKEVTNFEETELKDLISDCLYKNNNSFEHYHCKQQNLIQMLKHSNEDCNTSEEKNIDLNKIIPDKVNEHNEHKNSDEVTYNTKTEEPLVFEIKNKDSTIPANKTVVNLNKNPQEKVSSDQYKLAGLPNNAYVFLTMPRRLFTPVHNTDKTLANVTCDVSANVEVRNSHIATKNSKKKKDKSVGLTDEKKKENINKSAVKVLLFEKLKRESYKAEASSEAKKEGDSAIPFSCITTPEVVSSCNTTSTTSQAAIAVDPKPRSVISSSFNGLSLSRPNYGSTASTAPDEYKKSLDENGNAVQGFSSPISGSSQHKKPRRKKSSKNETVIKSHQIDGYQGNKDLNEVLRFIESNEEHGRSAKLGRKHKDDADDKGGKKRSSERRKDKEKVKRASSLEELSRTTLEDLTDVREPPRHHERKPRPDTKAERRSWGDDARDAFYYPAPATALQPVAPTDPEPPPPEPELDHEPEIAPVSQPPPPDATVELTDFQTVTKRRKPRRRADDAEREPPRRPRPPSPRPRRESAPPSDRSNDSNDDLDSVHSLPPPPPPPPPAPHASYADIARTRHNIPDLIESCNFYGEVENAGGRRAADTPAAAGDADGYPALGGAARLARGKAPPRRERKERPPPTPAGECPAPDVVGDRRPAVILLDSAARPRDMDGVTFGFDINEQLLGAGGRRPRCDLVRDALDAGSGGGAGAVPVVAGCAALRYVPPEPPPDTHHLYQIIDYVGSAWEDVVRCAGGKVRYFSE